MKLSQLGERKIIEELRGYFKPCSHLREGIGEDAAVVELDHKLLISSCEMIREASHIPEEMTPWQVGWYSVNVALSDIASMGARPLGLLFSLGLPEEMAWDYLRYLAGGIRDACDTHDTCVLGGDTKAHSELSIAPTALGIAGRVMTRSRAEVDELICVTGNIGEAAAGFHCLVKHLEMADRERLLKKAFEPLARVKEGMAISRYSKCCTDISDGLAYSLHEIAEQSGVGFEVHEGRVPGGRAVKEVSSLAGVPERELLFHKGGDFELLFTIKEKALESISEEMPGVVTPIGRVTGHGRALIDREGEAVELPYRGYESFLH